MQHRQSIYRSKNPLGRIARHEIDQFPVVFFNSCDFFQFQKLLKRPLIARFHTIFVFISNSIRLWTDQTLRSFLPHLKDRLISIIA